MKKEKYFEYQKKSFNKYNKYKIKKKIAMCKDEDKEIYTEFFNKLTSLLYLGKNQNDMMIRGYIKAITYYQNNNVEAKKIVELLDLDRLGDVYTKESLDWFPLDNSAIVYPLSMGHGTMGMFRLSYYLKEYVVPELLQIALNNTIKRFPTFRTSLRRGFFWHYLESSKTYFKVRLDNKVPCTLINLSSDKSQALKVYYNETRISIDFFHVLTDGAGGMVFINTLLAEYLRLNGKPVTYQENVLDINTEPLLEESMDAFYSVPDVKSSASFADKFPHQLKGRLSKTKKRVLHFTLDTNELLDLSHKHNATITVLMLALMFQAAKNGSKHTKGSFYIQIPMDMRKFYKSKTLRNFSLYAIIKARIDEIDDFDYLINSIKEQFKTKVTIDAMNEMSTMTKGLVKKLNYIPLLIKYVVMKVLYPFLSERVISTTLSNLGAINLPNDIKENIDKADFVLGVQDINRATCSLISVNSKSVYSISKVTNDTSFEDELYKLFIKYNLKVEVTGGENFGL